MNIDDTPRARARKEGPSDQDLRNASPAASGNRYARVGIFVLVGFFSFMAALFLLTDPSTFRGRYFLTTTVDNASGLRKGDPVQMRGVNIGRAHDFELLGDQVRVTLEVEGRWRVPTDSRSRLIELGVLGGKIVEILPGESAEYLEPGANLMGVEYAGLLGTAEVLGERADVIMGRVEEMLSEPTVEAVQASAQDLRLLLKELSGIAQDQSTQVAQLTASLNRTAQSLEETSAAGPDLASAATSAAERADSTLVQLRRTSAKLDGVAESLGSILERIDRGEGTLGQLATNDSLYHTLTAAVESVQLLATDLREHPERYVKVSVF